jgi:hypothetical protein
MEGAARCLQFSSLSDKEFVGSETGKFLLVSE